jgi:hypothetical protein
MLLLVKTKRQANFTNFKRFGALRGSWKKKTLYSTCSCIVCQLGFFGTREPLKRSLQSRFKLVHSCQKTPIYTRTRQINYYYGVEAFKKDPPQISIIINLYSILYLSEWS